MTGRIGFATVLLAALGVACAGGEADSTKAASEEPSRSEAEPGDARSSSESQAPTSSTDWVRIAPAECPPDPISGETDLWTAPDTIPLGEGASLELQGCESQGNGWAVLSYEGAAPTEPYHVVSVQYYEGGSWIVLNAESGTWQPVRGRPRFSPGGRWLATAAVDLEAEYLWNHVDIYEAGQDSIRRVLALDGDGAWGATDLRWVSEGRVEYLRVRRDDEPGQPFRFDSTAVGVSYEDGRWIPDSIPSAR